MPAFFRRFLYACYLPSSIVSSSAKEDQNPDHISQEKSKDATYKPTRTHPRISPLYARPEDFPRSTTIITCERDSLAREGIKLARKLQEADDRLGLDVVHWDAPGQG
jgi:acetyl esterase/lipase